MINIQSIIENFPEPKPIRSNMIEPNENPKRRRRRTKRKSSIAENGQEDHVNLTLMELSQRLDYRKLFPQFFALIMICSDLLTTMATASSLSSPCSLFKKNYSFDFAFNQIIRLEPNKNPTFHHYLYSKMHFFQLKSSANNRMDVIPFEYEFDPNLGEFHGDWGFSLPPTDNQRLRTSKICTGKIDQKHLTCVEMEYRQNSTISTMVGLMKNLERFPLAFPSEFDPSVAITPIEYYDFESSRFLVVFLEQKIQIPSLDPPSDGGQTTVPLLFQRKWRVYSMEKLDRITDLTYSTVIPDYLKMVPKHLEITGVFGWKRSDKGNDEHMISVFNGSHHFYCVGDSGSNKCSKIEYYQTFLEECSVKPNSSYSSSGMLTVTRCCGQWTEYDKIYNSNNDGDVNRLTVYDGRFYRVKSTSLFYLLWSLAILSILILVLLVFWLKSCISEARHDNEMMKIRAVQQQNSPQPPPASFSQGQHQKWKPNTKSELPPLSRKPRQQRQDKTIVDDHVDDDIIDVDGGQDVEKIKMIDSSKTTKAIVHQNQHQRPYPNSNQHVDEKVFAQQPPSPSTKTTKFIEHEPNINSSNQYEHRPNQRLMKLP